MQKSALSLAICVAASCITACSSGGLSPSMSSIPAAKAQITQPQSGPSPIEHIVLIIQENRTFNNLFATFPGATGATKAQKKVSGRDESITLKETGLGGQRNFNHNYSGWLTAYDDGRMDAFNFSPVPQQRQDGRGRSLRIRQPEFSRAILADGRTVGSRKRHVHDAR